MRARDSSIGDEAQNHIFPARLVQSLLGIAPLWLLSGCLTLGPEAVIVDRFEYSRAIRDSWEEQVLMNIVAMRYGEPPVFLEVASVISQYSLEVNLSTSGITKFSAGGDSLVLGGSTRWSNRPTITYTPIKGREFTVNLLTPIDPAVLFAMFEMGWNAKRGLSLTVSSINGISNYNRSPDSVNSKLNEIISLFRDLQLSHAYGLRTVTTETKYATYVYFRDLSDDPSSEAKASRLIDLLSLNPDASEFEFVFGRIPSNDRQIALVTHSILDILNNTADFIDAPQEHINLGLTQPTRLGGSRDPVEASPIRIASSKEQPKNAMVSIMDRGHWYYIDDSDLGSKKAFSLLLIMLRLTESDVAARSPLITIGTN